MSEIDTGVPQSEGYVDQDEDRPMIKTTNFSHEQMSRAALRFVHHECWHIPAEEQAAAKSDPEQRGLLCSACARVVEAGYMINQLLTEIGYQGPNGASEVAGTIK